MKHGILFFIAAVLLQINAYAQPTACGNAVDLNLTSAFMGPAQPEDTSVDYGCVTATAQHIWYGYFTVCQSGTLNIMSSASTSSNDVDLVVWGPFLNTGVLCSQLQSGAIAGCAATTNLNETVNLGTVMQGFVYMVAAVCDTNLTIPSFSSNGTAVISGNCATWTNCAPNAGYESLCLVTVDSATQEYKMVWQELAGNPVSYFGIMKADYQGVPQQIDTVQISSLSEYIDTSADPNVHTEQYSIMTYDTCGTFWAASGLFIQPVFCQSSLSTQGTVNVAWSPYIDMSGNGPVYYVVYRGATPNNMTPIDTVATFVNNYTDINPLVGTSYYKIGTALYSPCIPMRINSSAASVYQVASYSNAAPITVVGITENSLANVALFPNPSDGMITVKNLDQQSVMRVYDVAGRLVREEQLNVSSSQQVDLSGLEQGMYSVTIENEGGYYRKEIVIQR